jgi:oligosaccharide repeat unit polymerase
MVNFVNILTFCWVTLWAILSLASIMRGLRNSVYFVMLVFYLCMGLPLLLDVLVGKPHYIKELGFALASQDEAVALIYCAYISIVPVIWWMTKPRLKKANKSDSIEKTLRRLKLLWYLLLIAPPLLALFSPQPSTYLRFGAAALMEDIDAQNYHTFLAFMCLLSLVSALILLSLCRNITLKYLCFILTWLFISAWLNGKRHFIAYILLSLGFVLWQRRFLSRRSLPFFGVIALSILLIFSFFFQSKVRDISFDTLGFAKMYTNFRIDYGRDDVIKMTIYAELHPQRMQILEYRGQSLLFDLAMYIPRKLWPEKPLPYAQYFTSAMLLASPRIWGWSMTTSWLEEAIANFGWVGMLLGPLTIAMICRIGDKRGNPLVGILTVLIACLLLVVHLPAFAPLFVLWMMMVYITASARIKLRFTRRAKYKHTSSAG